MNKLRNILGRHVVMRISGSVVPGREEGQTLVEYGFILLLVAVVLVGAVAFLNGGISTLFSSVGDAV